MSGQTAAQEEFADFLAKNADHEDKIHPEDRADAAREDRDRDHDDEDEEDRYRSSQIDAAMRMPTFDHTSPSMGVKLPPASFDSGRATGVKGVIADARSYEEARRSKWTNKVRAVRRSMFGMDSLASAAANKSESEHSDDDKDEESFLQQWRESRRRELEAESKGGSIRNRRTSPSVRMYGRLDEVDAMGYLDAIEKVGRETVVVVFVYDHEVGAFLLLHMVSRLTHASTNSLMYHMSLSLLYDHW